MLRFTLRDGACLLMFAILGSILGMPAPGQDQVEAKARADSKNDARSKSKSETDTASGAGGIENTKLKPEPEFVFKTDEQWRRILTPYQYAVTRQRATEVPFTGKYATGHFRGTFLCVCCEARLFSADHKFESGTGWPSFWRPFDDKALDRAVDNSEGEPRMEVMCRRCGAHLGHVFDDGPPPTGWRFCINSVALKLKTTAGTDDASTPNVRTKAKPKSKRARANTTRSKAKAAPSSPPNSKPE